MSFCPTFVTWQITIPLGLSSNDLHFEMSPQNPLDFERFYSNIIFYPTENIQKTKIMASDPITSWWIDGKTMETVTDFIFLGSKITTDGDCSHEIRTLAPWKKSYDQPRQYIKKQGHYFTNKGSSSQTYGFSSSHVWMWELDYKEIWAPKNGCIWTVVLEKTLESLLDCKEIQPVHPKGNQFWIFIGRTDVEAETTWFEELTHLKRPWCWEKLKAGGEGEDRGWDGWMASPMWWTWVWASSGGWWWTGNPGVLQSMESQRVWHDWETVLNWLKANYTNNW